MRWLEKNQRVNDQVASDPNSAVRVHSIQWMCVLCLEPTTIGGSKEPSPVSPMKRKRNACISTDNCRQHAAKKRMTVVKEFKPIVPRTRKNSYVARKRKSEESGQKKAVVQTVPGTSTERTSDKAPAIDLDHTSLSATMLCE